MKGLMLLLSSLLMLEAFLSTRSAMVSVLPHPLHSKALLCSLDQSSSCPRRITSSPHPLHTSTIRPEVSIVRSDTFISIFTFSPCCSSPLVLAWEKNGRPSEPTPVLRRLRRNTYNLSRICSKD